MTSYELISVIIAGLALSLSGVALYFAIRATRANETSATQAGRANDLFVAQSFMTWWGNIVQEVEKAKARGDQEGARALSYTAEITLIEFCDRFIDDDATVTKVSSYIRGIFKTDPETAEKFLQHILKERYKPLPSP